jgi:hypothetical protein
MATALRGRQVGLPAGGRGRAVGGYEEYIEAIRDPNHERYEELLEWGGDFDPEEYDTEGVNEQLRRLR